MSIAAPLSVAASRRFPFTKRTLDALAGTTERVAYYDSDTPGLSLRITPAGVKTFSVHARAKGGAVERVSLGRYPQVSIEAARIRAKAVVAALARGESIADQARAERQQQAFGDLAAAYFADREREGRKSVRDMRMSYELYLGALPAERRARGRTRTKPSGAVDWSKRRPSQIAPDDIAQLRAALADSCGRTTANRCLQLLRAIVNFGRRMGYVERDHASALVDQVKLFKEQSRTRRLNNDEVAKFVATMNDEPNSDFRDFLTVLLYTGARRSNVMAMRWAELDLLARSWEIPATKAKGGRSMLVPLDKGAMEVLQRREVAAKAAVALTEKSATRKFDASERLMAERRAEWVFPAHSTSGHMEAPKKPWAAFRKRAGLADVRMHDLRRTLGSYMVDTGASLAVIGKQLGHRDAKSTAIYARLDLEPVRTALERAEGALRAAAAPKPFVADANNGSKARPSRKGKGNG